MLWHLNTYVNISNLMLVFFDAHGTVLEAEFEAIYLVWINLHIFV